MNTANERINIINVIILEYRVRIDPTLFVTLLYRVTTHTCTFNMSGRQYEKSAIINGS